jgi:hypothetical protein
MVIIWPSDIHIHILFAFGTGLMDIQFWTTGPQARRILVRIPEMELVQNWNVGL